jgi:hypothetical protein
MPPERAARALADAYSLVAQRLQVHAARVGIFDRQER